MDLQKKNEDLRAFRHDFNSHILSLQELSRQNNLTRLTNYIDNLSTVKEQIYSISTGNAIADAIINHLKDNLTKDTLFKVSGQFSSGCFIDDMDLCILLSNLLNNAAESISILEHLADKEIYVEIESSASEIVIAIENSSKAYTAQELQLLKTSKSDTKNHGFGLSNVINVIQKYNGEINIDYEDGFFKVYINLYLPFGTKNDH